MTLSDCLTRATRIWPDRTATTYLGRSRTWQQVSEDVGNLPAGLRSLGVLPGDRVALLGENSDRYLDSYFAAGWLGAAAVPLNTRLTRKELGLCLGDSGACILLAGDSASVAAAALAGDVPGVRRVVHIGESVAPPGIFYSGGTTGTPKGVVLSHDNLLANAAHVLPAPRWSESTMFLLAARKFHLAGICCLATVCVAAGRHVIVPRFDPEGVITAVHEHSGPLPAWYRR